MSFSIPRIKRMLHYDQTQRKVVAKRLEQGRWINSEDYNKLKQQRVCERCGKRGRMQIHHKQPVAQGGGNERSNLVALCEQCHQEIHRGEDNENITKDRG